MLKPWLVLAVFSLLLFPRCFTSTVDRCGMFVDYCLYDEEAGVESLSEGAKLVARSRLAGGTGFTCARKTDGSVKCWGYNEHGQLGLGDTANRGESEEDMGNNLPRVALGSGKSAKQIGGGESFACTLLTDGGVKCWGAGAAALGQGAGDFIGDGPNELGDNLPAINLGTGKTATQIAVGQFHVCALLNDGTLKCWGSNDAGELGTGNDEELGDQAAEMGDSLPSINLGGGKSAKQITAGRGHTCAILNDDSVKCWGHNGSGQLGLWHATSLGQSPSHMGDNLPTVNLGTGKTAKQIAAGWYHTCVILNEGSVKCWGDNSSGQLGQGHTNNLGDASSEMGDSLTEIQLGIGRTAKQIATGENHTCVILNDDRVKCWGFNTVGTIGLGDTDHRGDGANEMGDNLFSVDLGAGNTAKQIAAFTGHTCVLLNNDAVKCWGANSRGALGQGHGLTIGDGPDEMGDNLPPIDF